jgi:acyl transferase domain-containing protein
MDPQQRGLMENTYHAFENAGLRLEDVAGTKTSVHVGCFTSDFATMQFRDAQSIPKYNSLGTAGSMLANRLSWFFDLRGESMYVDTACSSSLVALALACQGLAAGESEMAVVSGSNVILIPEFTISLSNMKMLSPTGRCQSFDAKADGYGRGEGFATLILKSASKAIADGDPIRALIRSIGMNQDGYTSSGITQPSKEMQVKLIRETYRKSGLDMKHTRFFEAHGTGTAVGDPIEARAIGEAFFNHRSKEDPIYV